MRIIIMNFILILSICCWRTHALPDIIQIGGIFGPGEQRQELAFRYAVQNINDNRAILPRSRLSAMIEKLPSDDSFHASRRVCELLAKGVAGIFGPQSENAGNHVQSICDALEIPHIESRWDYKLTRDEYSFNLYPHPLSLNQAYHDVIKALQWNAFVILYDKNDGLSRFQSLLKVKEWTVTIRQLNEGKDWRPLLKDIKNSQDTKFVIDVRDEILYDVMTQANQMGLMREYHSYFITSLDMHLINMENFLYGGTNITALRIINPEKPEVKKIVENWSRLDSRFLNVNSKPGIRQITTEAALMYDAVHLFVRALDDLDKSKEVDITKLYCASDKTWKHGFSLVNYMKWYSSRRDNENSARHGGGYSSSSMHFGNGLGTGMGASGMGASGMGGMTGMGSVSGMTDVHGNQRRPGMSGRGRTDISRMPPNMGGNHGMYPVSGISEWDNFHSFMGPPSSYNISSQRQVDQVQVFGLTGIIQFDSQGFRTDFELEITEMEPGIGLKKVGIWTKKGGANYTRSSVELEQTVSKSLQNRTLIVTTAVTAPYAMMKETSKMLTGNDRFEGFCIDLMEKVSKDLKFNYTLELIADGSYGSKNKETGEWNGMVRALLDHKADLAIVDFTITYEREQAVDFSMPFMNLGIGIIYKKPQKKPPNLFSFMSPFSIDVWIYMATAYLGVSVLLYILARMSPKEWDSPYPCVEDPDELQNCFTLQNSLWFIIGTFLCQGADIAPRAVSTRIVAGIWWFFTLIMISSYTANLAAFLTVERMESPIEGAEDLAKQTKIKYGCKLKGSTYEFFEESNIPTYQRMWNAMSMARPSVFTKSNDLGVERVQNSEGMYAFLMESSSIEYEVERKCDLMQVGGLLDSKSYGIALPPGSPYTGAISSAILKLKETGEIHELKTKWWKRRKGGGRCVNIKPEDAASGLELGLDNVGGVFVVMAGGGALACVIACCEFTWKARKLAAQEGDSFLDELWIELKFIGRCKDNEKPVRRAKSSEIETESSNIYSASNNYGYTGK